jgi:hypothetical protein
MRTAPSVLVVALALAACKGGGDSASSSQNASTGGKHLLSGVSKTSWLAADDTNLYVATSDGTIFTVRRTGIGVASLGTGVPSPSDLLLAQGSLFYIGNGVIWVAPLPLSVMTTFATDASRPAGLVATRTRLYWIEQAEQAGDDAGTPLLALVSRALAGSGSKRIVAFYVGPATAGRAVVVGTSVYFTASHDTQDTVVLRAPVDGTGDAAETVATIPNGQISAMVTDGTTIFATVAAAPGSAAGQLVTISPASGAVATLLSGLAGPADVAVAGDNLFFTLSEAGQLVRVGVNGGAPATIASGLKNPTHLVVDTAAVHVLVDDGVVDIPE